MVISEQKQPGTDKHLTKPFDATNHRRYNKNFVN